MVHFRKQKHLFTQTSYPKVVLYPGNGMPGPRFSSGLNTYNRRRVPTGIKIALALLVLALIIWGGVSFFAQSSPVKVTLNGQEQTIQGDERTLGGLAKSSLVNVSPGNYVAVDGAVLRAQEGYPFTATVNDEPVEDASLRLNEGDVITMNNGADITEPYTEDNVKVTNPKVKKSGVGALHVYTEGSTGEVVTRTGQESHRTADVVIKEAQDFKLVYYNADTKGDKVIALTFDDGPWDKWTDQILQILQENDARATFFTVGQRIEGHEAELKAMHEAGHEIATHTYDHAAGAGKGASLDLMSHKARKEEVSKGLKAIEDAVGSGGASSVFRAPGGNFSEDTAADVADLVTGEIGWNVDTGDWTKPGVKTILRRIKSAGPGDIILMHDGGGDRSQTVAALKKALPALKEKGYEFITVSELINRYPYQAQ